MELLWAEPFLLPRSPIIQDPAFLLMIWFVGYAFLLFLWTIYSDRRRLWFQKKYPLPNLTVVPAIRDLTLGRRAWPRREGNPTPVLIAEIDGSGWQTGASVISRSQGGLRVVHTQPYEPGKRLRILSSHAPNQIWWVQVEVKNCRQTPNGWEMGCEFSDILAWNVLLLFG
jgi:hypothetical protein